MTAVGQDPKWEDSASSGTSCLGVQLVKAEFRDSLGPHYCHQRFFSDQEQARVRSDTALDYQVIPWAIALQKRVSGPVSGTASGPSHAESQVPFQAELGIMAQECKYRRPFPPLSKALSPSKICPFLVNQNMFFTAFLIGKLFQGKKCLFFCKEASLY